MDNFSIRICAYLAEGLFRCYEKQGTSLHLNELLRICIPICRHINSS